MKSKRDLRHSNTMFKRNKVKNGIIPYNDDIRVQKLVDELESMRDEWRKQIDELKNKKAEYEILIKQLRAMEKAK